MCTYPGNTPGENQMCTYPGNTMQKIHRRKKQKKHQRNTPVRYAAENTPPGETKYVHIQEIPGFRYKLPDSSWGLWNISKIKRKLWWRENVLYFVWHINISPETGWDWEMIGLGISKSQTGESLFETTSTSRTELDESLLTIRIIISGCRRWEKNLHHWSFEGGAKTEPICAHSGTHISIICKYHIRIRHTDVFVLEIFQPQSLHRYHIFWALKIDT